MAQKSKACDTALNFALQTIEAKNSLIDGQSKLIALRGIEIENYRLLDANWSARLTNQNELFQIQREKDRYKIKKQRKTIFGLSGGIVILVAILVL
jgi:hypothetical protein